MSKPPPTNPGFLTRGALYFVLLLGLVSLFADLTYEGARSIIGPYLAMLGASATAVGIVAGFGELTGSGLRLASGYVGILYDVSLPILIAFSAVMQLVSVPLLLAAAKARGQHMHP